MRVDSTLLPPDWALPHAVRQRVGVSAGRQRVLDAEGHLVLVLHAPPGADDTERRGRFFWRDPQGTWQVAPKAERITNLREHLLEYEAQIERLEASEDAAHQSSEYFALLDELSPLKRATRNMHDTLQQARQAVPEDRSLIVARDEAYELMRRCELLYDDLNQGLNFAVAWQAEQQADSSFQMMMASYRLNILVAFFFPVATLMAILGANLRNGLEPWDRAAAPLPLVMALAVGIACGIGLLGYVTRPAKRPCRDHQSNSSSSSTRRSK